MADHDRGLTTLLERVSDTGQAAARPQPAAFVRATANRRTRRNRVVLAGALVLVVAGGSTLVWNGGGATRSENNRTPAAPSHGQAPTQLATAPSETDPVPDEALLSPDDPAVSDALGGTRGSVLAMAKVPDLDPLCRRGYASAAPGTVAVRTPQIVGDSTTAIVIEFVTLYDSETSATAAVAAATTVVGRCAGADRIDGSRRNIDVRVPEVDTVLAWGGTFQEAGPINRHRAVVRDGDLVAYLVIDSANRNVTDSQARAIVETAAQRLHAATL